MDAKKHTTEYDYQSDQFIDVESENEPLENINDNPSENTLKMKRLRTKTIEELVSTEATYIQQYFIPRTILIKHKYDLCNASMPSSLQSGFAANDTNYWPLYANVQRLKAYNPDFEFICFDEVRAYEYLKKKDESLAEYFKNEENGAFKSDLFRVVYLYYEGGYYMDSDMEPMMPLNNIFNARVTFTTAWDPESKENWIANTYMGATPFNEILRVAMDLFHDTYLNNKPKGMLGPELMARSVKQFTNESTFVAIQEKKVYKDQFIHLLQQKYYDGPNKEQLTSQRDDKHHEHALYDDATDSWPFWTRCNGKK